MREFFDKPFNDIDLLNRLWNEKDGGKLDKLISETSEEARLALAMLLLGVNAEKKAEKKAHDFTEEQLLSIREGIEKNHEEWMKALNEIHDKRVKELQERNEKMRKELKKAPD